MIGYIILLALVIFVVVLFFYCAFTESKRISKYKNYRVFGRWWAYTTATFLLAGASMTVLSPSLEYAFSKQFNFVQTLMVYILPGISMFCMGLFMAIRTRRKCGALLPDAQKHCIRDMIFCGMGMGCKITIFFFRVVWEVTKPREIVDSNGNRLYVYDGDVYTEDGRMVGTMAEEGGFIPNEAYRYFCNVY